MDNSSIYTSLIQAKNGTFIPVFSNGKTVESRYNPENSCALVSDSVTKSGFFVVTGIASGLLIKTLAHKFPESFILALEEKSADIDFLLQLENVKDCSELSNVSFCTLETLESTIINKYLPALYGDFQLIQQKPWLSEHEELCSKLPDIINKSLKQVAADYSVQSHFGKRWQKNIITNLKLIDKKSLESQNFDLSKTAAIIAAGPSFDKTIQKLLHHRNEYFIFSTDTAYSALIKQGLIPEVVVSIDGQLVSYNHFFNFNKADKTAFYFDLCGNSSAVKALLKKSGNLNFFVSGHPFCAFVNQFTDNSLPFISAGSGTVTISCVDLALKAGFTKLELFGADFAYLNGKAYTKGTYLDSLYSKASSRIKPLETNFDKLIFRVPLKALETGTGKKGFNNSYTTEMLESYKKSLEEYLAFNNCSFTKTDDSYFITNNSAQKQSFKPLTFDYKGFINYFENINDSDLQTVLLPLIAALRKSKPDSTFPELLKLARRIVVSYN